MINVFIFDLSAVGMYLSGASCQPGIACVGLKEESLTNHNTLARVEGYCLEVCLNMALIGGCRHWLLYTAQRCISCTTQSSALLSMQLHVCAATPLPCVWLQCCVAMFCAEPILLDGLLQAVMLHTGDVVAVRTQARPIPTYFGCFEHQMQLNPKSIHRPVLAALMQVSCYSLLQPAAARAGPRQCPTALQPEFIRWCFHS